MILALTDSCPSVQEVVGNERCESSRKQCRTILSRMAAQSSESHRYLKLFESMYRMIQLNIQGMLVESHVNGLGRVESRNILTCATSSGPKISHPKSADARDLVLEGTGRHAWANPSPPFLGCSVPFSLVDHSNLNIASGSEFPDFAPFFQVDHPNLNIASGPDFNDFAPDLPSHGYWSLTDTSHPGLD